MGSGDAARRSDVKPQEVLAALRAAAETLSVRDRWVYGSLAVDAKGGHVDPWDKKAVKFCASAAIQKALGSGDDSPVFKAAITELNVTVGKLYPEFHAVESMNDGKKGYERVIKTYAETIKRVGEDAALDKPAKTERAVPDAQRARASKKPSGKSAKNSATSGKKPAKKDKKP